MLSHLAVSVLGVFALGLTSVSAQTRTWSGGLSRRSSTDICAELTGAFDVKIPSVAEPVDFGTLDVCACVSNIPDLLQSYSVFVAVASAIGTELATAAVTAAITDAGASCTYPERAIPVCESTNPCGFSCSDGFTPDPQSGECVCESPNAYCFGICQASCPSSVATDRRRAASPFDRVANRRRMCPRGFTPCGLFEQRGQASEPWECVDVRYELESCGGCMTPLDSLSPQGVDCTALPGVADVSCTRGSCVVRRCKSGYAVTADRSRCVPIAHRK